MGIGDENYSSNLPALGRFKPKVISGANYAESSDDYQVGLATDLPGTPIKFTVNQSMDSIVATGNLTLLNGTLDEDTGETIAGVIGEIATAEDIAKYGSSRGNAEGMIALNTLCWVTEFGGGLGTCTSNWRVSGVTMYTDENGVPFTDVELEGLGQIALDTKFDPTLVGAKDQVLMINSQFFKTTTAGLQHQAEIDGYRVGDTDTAGHVLVIEVENATEFLAPFINQIDSEGFGVANCPGDLFPNSRVISKGESCWQLIEDVMGWNGYTAYVTLQGKLIYKEVGSTDAAIGVWTQAPTNISDSGVPIYTEEEMENPPLPAVDIGTLGNGLSISYSKAGVASKATVYGYVCPQDDNGEWIQNKAKPETVEIYSSYCLGLLGGIVVEIVLNIESDIWFPTVEMLSEYGAKELAKTAMGARTASGESESIPLSVQVGTTVSGGGSSGFGVTALSRTTDVQQNKISTSITGSMGGSGGEEEGTPEGGETSSGSGWTEFQVVYTTVEPIMI